MRDRKRSLVWYTGLAAVLAVGVISSWPLAEVFAQGPTGGASGNADPEGLNFFSLLTETDLSFKPLDLRHQAEQHLVDL